MKSNHARQNYMKALWIYVIALLLLGLTFHSEAQNDDQTKPTAIVSK